MRHGFDLGYKTWVHHDEPALPPPPAVIDNTRQPQMSDMTALLNDLSYIPSNNEHNEPTQGDIGQNCSFPGDMSPGNVAGDKSGTKTRSEFTNSSQNVKQKKLLLGDFNSITTTSHPPPPPAPPPQNPPPPLLTT
nr:hypothetical protein [Tanacetum cinerariifolium]